MIVVTETIRPIKKGEEIYSFYGYGNEFLHRIPGVEWYYDQWQEWKIKNPNHQNIKIYESEARKLLNVNENSELNHSYRNIYSFSKP